MVFFGSYDHHVYALDASTGELNWKFDTGQLVISSPVYSNGKVMIGSRSADLYTLNAKTGREEWSYYHWGSWVESSGTIFDDRLYIGSSDDQLLKSFNPENGREIQSSDENGAKDIERWQFDLEPGDPDSDGDGLMDSLEHASFSISKRSARTGRNPQTGKEIQSSGGDVSEKIEYWHFDLEFDDPDSDGDGILDSLENASFSISKRSARTGR